MNKPSTFYRYPEAGHIAGVCAGVGDFLGWNPKWIRLLAVLSFIFGGGFPILLIYAALWYLMDEAPGKPSTDGTYPAGMAPRPGTTTRDVRDRFLRMEERLRNMEACVASDDYELRREFRKLGA